MKIKELRSILRHFDRDELAEILVEMYKALPKTLIEEKAIDALIVDREQFLEVKQHQRKISKETVRRGEGHLDDNVASISGTRRWMSIPDYARQLILNNVWCSHCSDVRGLSEYTVKLAGPDIVLRGTCPVCHHDVARHVEVD